MEWWRHGNTRFFQNWDDLSWTDVVEASGIVSRSATSTNLNAVAGRRHVDAHFA